MAKVLILATNYGSWGEELQAPWDVLKKAGHDLTLATPLGKKPLPLAVSVDSSFVDPVQNYPTNPPDVCARIKALTDGNEWAHPIKYADASMKDYAAVVLTGGLGAMIDICNNWQVHRLIMEAYRSNKLIAALCLVSLAVPHAALALAGATSKPNVLFILCDDIRWNAMSCAGHPYLKTPNIDRIANEGVRFENMFCTTSLCSPSRASILSGL